MDGLFKHLEGCGCGTAQIIYINLAMGYLMAVENLLDFENLLIFAALFMGVMGFVSLFLIPRRGIYITGTVIILFGLFQLYSLVTEKISQVQGLVTLVNIILFLLIGVLLIVKNFGQTRLKEDMAMLEPEMVASPEGQQPGMMAQPGMPGQPIPGQVPMQGVAPQQQFPAGQMPMQGVAQQQQFPAGQMPMQGVSPQQQVPAGQVPMQGMAPQQQVPAQPAAQPVAHQPPQQAAPQPTPEGAPMMPEKKMMAVKCPRCGTKIEVDASQKEAIINCPQCGARGKITL